MLLKLKWLLSQGGGTRKSVFSLIIFDCHIYWLRCKIVDLRTMNKRFLTELKFMLLNQRFY